MSCGRASAVDANRPEKIVEVSILAVFEVALVVLVLVRSDRTRSIRSSRWVNGPFFSLTDTLMPLYRLTS